MGNIDQVGASVLKPFDYAALGHIHKPMKVEKDIWSYCGTPLACSVSEAGQVKAIQMIEMREKGNTKMTAIPLYPRHEVKVIRGTLTEILEAASDDYVSVVLTDEVDLDIFDMQHFRIFLRSEGRQPEQKMERRKKQYRLTEIRFSFAVLF